MAAGGPAEGDRPGLRPYILWLMKKGQGISSTRQEDARLKRLKFRAWHRGFREADLIMGHFADAHLEALDEVGLTAFEKLLDAPDQDVYGWILGRSAPPPEHDTQVLAMLREFNYFAGTLWIR